MSPNVEASGKVSWDPSEKPVASKDSRLTQMTKELSAFGRNMAKSKATTPPRDIRRMGEVISQSIAGGV
jgi:hypothetical protein